LQNQLVKRRIAMKKMTTFLLASLIGGTMSVPVADAQSDRDRGDDRRYDSRDDRGGNWWENIFNGNTRDDRRDLDRRNVDRRDLEGTWYLNGDRDKRTEIIASRDGFEARNEKGSTSRLEVSRNGDVYAREWERGLRGNVRRDRIEWENGTTWTREPSSREARR
jgi:hypothetical protein